MRNNARIYFFLAACFGLALVGCSKDSSVEPKGFSQGLVTFVNRTAYTVELGSMSQNRHGDSETTNLHRLVYTSGRINLPNLIDGGVIFSGGDEVALYFQSVATLPYEPETPLFSHTVSLTVNGTQVITIKGENGNYDISGD
jgi:hypothetical protein